MTVALEDNFEDIIAKAQRGLGFTDDALAAAADIKVDTLLALKKGRVDESALVRLAPALNLHGPSLLELARKAWYPRVPNLTGLAQISSAWRDFRVNAFILWNPVTRQAAVFDTGTDAQAVVTAVRENKLHVELLMVTHSHGDHVACLGELRKELGEPRVFASPRASLPDVETINDGSTLSLGSLHLEARCTSGHAPDGLTYVVNGLAQSVAVVGDALFAGSIGGARGPEAYAEALQTIRTQILSLHDDTVICPGHGPRTTVGQEKQHNPFFPEFK